MDRRVGRSLATAIAVLLGVLVGPAVAGQGTTPLLVDHQMTVGAGASAVVAIGEALARVEDAFIPVRLFAERGVGRRAANIAYRVLKLTYFDSPQEQLLLVANHEVFGHGARLRERFNGPVGYRIDAPVPYGRGGGSTSFDFDREPSVHELLLISTGGMEANAVAADITARRAFADGSMRPRDALRYLGFELDAFSYVRGTSDDGEEAGHDVSDFLGIYNESAAQAGGAELSAATLRRQVLVGLGNPMLAFAAYGVYRSIWNGSPRVRVPAISVGGVRYLPAVRYRLTPYGTEWEWANDFGGRIGTTSVDVRRGTAVGARPWGVGVRRPEVTQWHGWGFGARIDLWRQPDVAGRRVESPDRSLRTGMLVRVRGERRVAWLSGTDGPTVILDVGVKTAGFVPGEPLRGGAQLRVGFGLPLAR